MRTLVIAATLVVVSVSPLVAQQAPELPSPPAWEVMLGAGANLMPRYAGANEHQLFPIPMTQVVYRQRIYLGPSTTGNGVGLGAYLVRRGGLGVAAEAGFLPDRPADRADALAGMEDRAFVATASGAVSYTLGRFEASASATQGLNDGAGLLTSGRLAYTQPVGARLITTIGIGATLANARQMRWDFGVTRREAARRQALIDAGDERLDPDDGRAFSPEAGLRHLGASLSALLLLDRHWALIGFGGVDRLSDEAMKSPLVRERQQLSGGLGIGYRF